MKIITTCISIILIQSFCFSQQSKETIDSLRIEHYNELMSPEEGLLNSEEITNFKGLDYL